MKHLFLLTGFIFLSFLIVNAQDTVKTNPIIYADAGLGIAAGDNSGILLNLGINYQVKKSLLTIRANAIGDNFPEKIVGPGPRRFSDLYEIGGLYGRRFIKNGHSLSFSAGLAFDDRPVAISTAGQVQQKFENRYPAVPFEINMLWFRRNMQYNPLHRILKVNETWGYGGSIGVRLSGNVSRYSYVAIGVVAGLGVHKRY